MKLATGVDNNEVLAKEYYDLGLVRPTSKSVEGQRIEIRNKLIVNNYNFILRCAWDQNTYHSFELSDLLNIGVSGFILGIDKFKPNKGFKLLTYCQWTVFQVINHAVRGKDSLIRIPVSRIKEVQLHEYEPTDARNEIKEKNHKIYAMASLDRPQINSDGDDCTLGEMIPDKRRGVEVTLDTEIDRAIINEAMEDYLTPEQSDVLNRLFGLNGFLRQTQNEVGKTMGLTESRINQIARKSFLILKDRAGDKLKCLY